MTIRLITAKQTSVGHDPEVNILFCLCFFAYIPQVLSEFSRVSFCGWLSSSTVCFVPVSTHLSLPPARLSHHTWSTINTNRHNVVPLSLFLPALLLPLPPESCSHCLLSFPLCLLCSVPHPCCHSSFYLPILRPCLSPTGSDSSC